MNIGFFRRGARLMFLVACLTATGCQPRSRIELQQAFAPPSQRQIQLAGDLMYRDARGEREVHLLGFPLPGSHGGPNDFIVYLDLPAGEGTWVVGGQDQRVGRGFLIQMVGDRRGKTLFERGTVRASAVMLNAEQRRLDIDIYTQDNTRVVGTAIVRVAPSELAAFETRHAADVAALVASTASGEGGQTAQRAGG